MLLGVVGLPELDASSRCSSVVLFVSPAAPALGVYADAPADRVLDDLKYPRVVAFWRRALGMSGPVRKRCCATVEEQVHNWGWWWFLGLLLGLLLVAFEDMLDKAMPPMGENG